MGSTSDGQKRIKAREEAEERREKALLEILGIAALPPKKSDDDKRQEPNSGDSKQGPPR